MNKKNKKQLISALLALCCCFSGWLLYSSAESTTVHLQRFAQVDSLIQLTCKRFEIQPSKISIQSIRIDSAFTRKIYRISVPSVFPKTQFHMAMQRELDPYRIAMPARVFFPEKDMQIYLQYHQTIIRTIRIITQKSTRE